MALAKGGHLNYLRLLHNKNKLLYGYYPLYLPAISEGHVHILDWVNEIGYFPKYNEYNFNDDIVSGLCEAIQCAAKNGHFKVLKWLRNEDLDIEIALIGAAEGGQLELLEWLFNKRVYPDFLTLEDISKAAAKGGHLNILKWLKTKGLKLNHLAAEGAAEGGHLHLLQYLEQKGIKCRDICDSAIKGGQLKLLQHLIQTGHTSPSIKIGHDAIKSGSVELLDWLLKNGYYEDKEAIQITTWAADYEHFHVLKWAITNGFESNIDCVDAAAYAGNLQILKFLKENGVAFTGSAAAAAASKAFAYIKMAVREWNQVF